MGRSALAAVALLSLAAFVLLVGEANNLHSVSIDLAHHYALVVRLTETWVLPNVGDPSLGEMSFYPRLSHQLATIFAHVVGSPLLGMHLVSLLAIFVIWAGVGGLMLSLPHRLAVASAFMVAVLLILNRMTIRLDLHAAEVINNYFFAQLVAQAFVIAMVLLALRLEQIGMVSWQRHTVLGVAVYVAASIHLLPALMFLLFFLGLVCLEMRRLVRHSTWPWLGLVAQAVPVLLACLALARHPTLTVMREISGNNGQVIADFMPSTNQFLGYGLLLLTSSTALLWRSLLEEDKAAQGGGDGLALKYLSLYGLAVSALCLLQVCALKAGHGSEYAVQKYLFALNTVLLLQLALWPVLLLFPGPGSQASVPYRNSAVWLAFILCGWFCMMPTSAKLSTSALVRLEHQVRVRQDLLMPAEPGKFNHVQGVGAFPPLVDYMLTIGLLHTPRAITRLSQPEGDAVINWRMVGSLVTSAGSQMDVNPACRRAPASGGLVVLDGACLGRAFGLRQVIGFTAMHPPSPCVATGLSVPEPFGTWTSAPIVRLRCPMPPSNEMQPTRLEIEATAFLNRVPAQVVRVNVLGQTPVSYVFDSSKPLQRMTLSLPEGLGREVTIELQVPNAASPRDLGLGDDGRALGLLLRTIEFK